MPSAGTVRTATTFNVYLLNDHGQCDWKNQPQAAPDEQPYRLLKNPGRVRTIRATAGFIVFGGQDSRMQSFSGMAASPALEAPAANQRHHYRHPIHSLVYATLDEGNGGIIRNLSESGRDPGGRSVAPRAVGADAF